MKINIWNAAISTRTGLGSVCFKIHESLALEHGVGLEPLNPTVWMQDEQDIPGWYRNLLYAEDGRRIKVHDICLNINYPSQFGGLENQKCVAFGMFESEKIPNHLVKCFNNQDVIIVPCEQNLRSFRESGVTRPLHKVPLGNDWRDYHYLERDWNITTEGENGPNPFTFLICGATNWRKGWDLVPKAFKKVFPKEQKDVALVVKVSKQYTSPFQMNALNAVDPRIFIIKEHISIEEMRNLYQASHCYVGPSRGDAWNLLAFQAMATGIPAITTNYCGPEEYQDISIPLNYKMAYNGSKVYDGEWGWYGEPDFDHLCDLMKWAYDNQEACREKGKIASDTIRDKYTWTETARQVKEIIENC